MVEYKPVQQVAPVILLEKQLFSASERQIREKMKNYQTECSINIFHTEQGYTVGVDVVVGHLDMTSGAFSRRGLGFLLARMTPPFLCDLALLMLAALILRFDI